MPSRSLQIFTLSALLTAGTAFAQTPQAQTTPGQDAASGANYSCVVDIVNATDTCGSPVTVDSLSGAADERRITADLNAGFSWQSLTVRYRVCNPSGWVWNVGDSPSNNGYSGDGGDTRHDAEAQLVGTTIGVYNSDLGSGSLACQFTGAVGSTGCVTQQITVRNDYFAFDPNTNTSGSIDVCSGLYLFDFPSYDEADSEDPSGLYEDKIYVGLDRVVANNFRNGDGVQKACVFLSTEASPSDATIDSECGF